MAKETDRELLELAAKAAELPIMWSASDSGGILINYNATPDTPIHHWNPLTDDGDALRLAVALSMRIRPMPSFGDDLVLCCSDHVNTWADEPFAGDPGAATRRAIVRVAAEIGRRTP